MRIAVGNLNSGVEISYALAEEVKKEAYMLKGRGRMKLYDLGFQSSPSEFSKLEFREHLVNWFPKWFKFLYSSSSAEIQLDCLMLKYAKLKSRLDLSVDNESHILFENVLSACEEYLMGSEMLDSVRLLVSKSNLSSNSNKRIKPCMHMSSGVEDHGRYALGNRGVYRCIVRKPNTHLETIDARSPYLIKTAQCVGVSDSDITNHLRSGKAFFIKGFSRAEELDFIDYLLDGTIVADGTFGGYLANAVTSNYKKSFNNDKRFIYQTFKSQVFLEALPEMGKIVANKRKSVLDAGGRDFYINNEFVMFEVPNEGEEAISDSCIVPRVVNTGAYIEDYMGTTHLARINTLNGYSGEFISASDVATNGYYAVGTPVVLYSYANSKGGIEILKDKYYSIDDVSYSDKRALSGELIERNLIPRVGTSKQVEYKNLNEVYARFGVSEETCLTDRVFAAYRDEIPDRQGVLYQVLVAELVAALIEADCMVFTHAMLELDYSSIGEDMYFNAQYDAEMLYSRLVF